MCYKTIMPELEVQVKHEAYGGTILPPTFSCLNKLLL